MPSYGFEFEFVELRFIELADMQGYRFEDGQNMFVVEYTNDEVRLLDIKSDNWSYNLNQIRTSLVEASSIGSTVNIADDEFAVLTAFLQKFLEETLKPNNFVLPGTIWALGDLKGQAIRARYLPQTSIRIANPKSLKDIAALAVNPQFTFGMATTLQLQRFIMHFSPFTIFPELKKYFAYKNGDYLIPYNDHSRTQFDAIPSLASLTMKLTLWRCVELLRLSLAFSIVKIPEKFLWMGNKAYMSIMARVSFRSMFNMTLGGTQLADVARYIVDSFSNLKLKPDDINPAPRYRLPFNPMAPNSLIGVPIKANFTTGYKNALIAFPLTYYAYSVLKALPLPRSRALTDVVDADNLLSELPAGVAMKNNIKTYDYLSPVPFSENDDAMGYYTRYPPKYGSIPKYFFEVRYAGRFLKSVNSGLPDSLVYSVAFQNACADQFDLAVEGWK